MSVTFSVEEGRLNVAHSEESRPVQIETRFCIVAKILNILSWIFPCCIEGTTQVTVDQSVVYVSRSAIREKMQWNGTDRCDSAEDLRSIALSYFSQKVPLEAQALSKKFQALRDQAEKSSGYTVHLNRPWSGEYSMRIAATGSQGKDIGIPDGATDVFAKTFKEGRSSLCNELYPRTKKFGMFPVFSRSGNLLIVPETRYPKKWAHLFCLGGGQLEKVFGALIETLDFLKEKDSSYVPNVEWHVGRDGYQTVGLLHTRIQGLPSHLRT